MTHFLPYYLPSTSNQLQIGIGLMKLKWLCLSHYSLLEHRAFLCMKLTGCLAKTHKPNLAHSVLHLAELVTSKHNSSHYLYSLHIVSTFLDNLLVDWKSVIIHAGFFLMFIAEDKSEKATTQSVLLLIGKSKFSNS